MKIHRPIGHAWLAWLVPIAPLLGTVVAAQQKVGHSEFRILNS